MAKRRNRHQTKTTSRQPEQNRRWLWLAAAAAVVLLAAAAFFILTGRQPAPADTVAAANLPAEIGIEDAYQKYQDGAFVLDVRTPEEWDDFHAPGTTLIPLNELESRLDEVPHDREVVVVCRSGNRSQAGRDILRQAGFERVSSMSGGMNAWRNAGYPVE
jgi:rhodanese-related sulfurtransferase